MSYNTLQQSSGKAFEFGWHAKLLPNYLRGAAFIQLRNACEAEVEFKKVLERSSIDPTSIICHLSQLGFARVYTLRYEV